MATIEADAPSSLVSQHNLPVEVQSKGKALVMKAPDYMGHEIGSEAKSELVSRVKARLNIDLSHAENLTIVTMPPELILRISRCPHNLAALVLA